MQIHPLVCGRIDKTCLEREGGDALNTWTPTRNKLVSRPAIECSAGCSQFHSSLARFPSCASSNIRNLLPGSHKDWLSPASNACNYQAVSVSTTDETRLRSSLLAGAAQQAPRGDHVDVVGGSDARSLCPPAIGAIVSWTMPEGPRFETAMHSSSRTCLTLVWLLISGQDYCRASLGRRPQFDNPESQSLV